MNQLARYIILATTLAIILFLLWYFSSIVAYILISAVLSLVGKPIVDLVSKIKIKGWHPPKIIGATLALLTLWMLFILFFRVMIPLVINQVNQLSSVNVPQMIASFNEPINQFDSFIREYLPASAREFSLQDFLIDKISSVFHVGMLSDLFSSTASLLGNLVITAFSVTFITFFFLRDESLFFDGVAILFPAKLEQNLRHALISINKLLRRYFIGIFIQSTLIMILDTIGLTIVGVNFQTAVVIGLIAGILNLVPYVGPLAGTIIGVLIGIATNLDLNFSTQMVPLIIYMLIVFGTVQLIDNFVFQPLIFSNSVNAHPLEIFIVLLIAGSVGGILGMLLAIPGYTVLRVFAKEFFNKFRVVQKLTQKI
ncbi:MAG TPA: AI-2E family transporter [Tenuifilaceae bacterium]|nr:AI-2E family transporter [Tenuifilaceae bacterium]HPE18606.1 AI-2E family transporter [Tenuifilaceae bacterium]HPJ46023.1 AI-2E family transporter [Tenuifilaceae bacterium]HPQ34726.1 AI-2E family transporter [Tenuifilaceae bacterium]HRX67355.1 AI-2E family transporter [Tenuifilaceae bacterium]